jgi:hypothetical protein
MNLRAGVRAGALTGSADADGGARRAAGHDAVGPALAGRAAVRAAAVRAHATHVAPGSVAPDLRQEPSLLARPARPSVRLGPRRSPLPRRRFGRPGGPNSAARSSGGAWTAEGDESATDHRNHRSDAGDGRHHGHHVARGGAGERRTAPRQALLRGARFIMVDVRQPLAGRVSAGGPAVLPAARAGRARSRRRRPEPRGWRQG